MQGDEIKKSQSALVSRQQIETELAALHEIQGQLLLMLLIDYCLVILNFLLGGYECQKNQKQQQQTLHS
jgi:hypothetical protein